MAAIAQPRFVEAAEPVAMEMDLAAPTEEEDKQRLKKEFQKIKEKEEVRRGAGLSPLVT